MSDRLTPRAGSESTRAEYQFGLQAFLLMFVVVALLTGYLRTFAPEVVGRFGVTLAVVLPLGGAVGWLTGRFAAAVFWGAVGTVLGSLAVCGAVSGYWADLYVWPMLGGALGITAAVCNEGQIARRMLGCALVALAIMATYLLGCHGLGRERVAELVCASGGGALIGLGVELIGRFERFTSMPRHFLILGLVVLAIAGHWISVRIVPGL